MHTITAVAKGSRIYVASPFALKDVAKSIPGGRWDSSAKQWHYPLSPVVAANIRRAYESCHPAVSAFNVDKNVLTLLAQAEAAADTSAKSRTDLPNPPIKTEAWLHQRQAYAFLKDRSGVMYMGMGTGKTLCYVALLDGNNASTAVIITTRKGRRVFPKQFRLHSNREWIVANGVKKRDGSLKKSAPLSDYVDTLRTALAHGKATQQPVALVVNYDVIWREPMHSFIKEVLSQQPTCVIEDESHRGKAPGSKTSLAMAAFGKLAERVWQGSGTWLTNEKVSDAYSQTRAIDSGYFGTSVAKARQRYCQMGGFENRQVVGYQNEDEFNSILAQFVFTAETDDVLDLPPVQHFVRPIDLSDKTRKVIAQLEADFEAGIEEGRITASNALTRLLRQQQATSGLAVLDPTDDSDESEVVVIGTEKQEDLAELLLDLPQHEKVVVVCRFVHDLDSVRSVVEASGRVYGEVSGRREDTTEDATFPDHIDVMGVQIQSGSEAIDLTAARHCVMYSVGYSLKDYEQVLRRVHRPGQTRETFYHHLIAQRSVDEKVYAALALKKAIIQAVIDYTKNPQPLDADALESVLNEG